MGASFNKVILLGNITRDIELKYLQSGTAVTEIGMAINSRIKGKDGNWIDDVTFVDVTLWGRVAEVASQYLGKGSQVLIDGRLKLDQWEKDGQKRQKLKVVGERLQMLGGGPEKQADSGESEPAGQQHDSAPQGDDETPF